MARTSCIIMKSVVGLGLPMHAPTGEFCFFLSVTLFEPLNSQVCGRSSAIGWSIQLYLSVPRWRHHRMLSLQIPSNSWFFVHRGRYAAPIKVNLVQKSISRVHSHEPNFILFGEGPKSLKSGKINNNNTTNTQIYNAPVL